MRQLKASALDAAGAGHVTFSAVCGYAAAPVRRSSAPCSMQARAAQPPIQCHALTCVCGWKLNPMHWACSHHALGRATQQIQDGDDGQPAGAASARSVEGVRRGRSDIWPYPMARSASPAASAHVGKPLDPSSRAQADNGCWCVRYICRTGVAQSSC